MTEETPESEIAREVVDAVVAAYVKGEASNEAVGWASRKAFEVYRREAHEKACEQIAQERASRRTKRKWGFG